MMVWGLGASKCGGLWPETLRNIITIKVWALKGNLIYIAARGFHGFRNITNILVGWCKGSDAL